MEIKTEHFSPNKKISVTINIHCLLGLHQFLFISTVDDTENVSQPHQPAQLLCVYPRTQHNLSKPGPWFGIILLRSDRDNVSDIVASAIFFHITVSKVNRSTEKYCKVFSVNKTQNKARQEDRLEVWEILWRMVMVHDPGV